MQLLTLKLSVLQMTKIEKVVSKDSEFLDNYILDGSPRKLLLVSTGNIKNQNLIRLF